MYAGVCGYLRPEESGVQRALLLGASRRTPLLLRVVVMVVRLLFDALAVAAAIGEGVDLGGHDRRTEIGSGVLLLVMVVLLLWRRLMMLMLRLVLMVMRPVAAAAAAGRRGGAQERGEVAALGYRGWMPLHVDGFHGHQRGCSSPAGGKRDGNNNNEKGS